MMNSPEYSMRRVYRSSLVLLLGLACMASGQAATWCKEMPGEWESIMDPPKLDQQFTAKLIEPEELHEQLQSGADRPILTDLRPKEQFYIAHIPGALSVRGSGLRPVVDGSNRTVVLIGTGYDDEALAMQARKLADSVARVGIGVLRGGMAAWALRDHLPLAGVRDLEQLLAVPAEPALLLIEKRNWRVLTDETSDDAAVDSKDEPAGYLWVDSDGADSHRHAAELSVTLGRPVFYAKGGRKALLAAGHEREQRLAVINSRPATGCGL